MEEEEKKKEKLKEVKYRRSSLWKKAKERIASFPAAKWKGEEEAKKGRESKKKKKRTRTRQVVGKSGR